MTDWSGGVSRLRSSSTLPVRVTSPRLIAGSPMIVSSAGTVTSAAPSRCVPVLFVSVTVYAVSVEPARWGDSTTISMGLTAAGFGAESAPATGSPYATTASTGSRARAVSGFEAAPGVYLRRDSGQRRLLQTNLFKSTLAVEDQARSR
ncbi:MAG: hypothetical protein H0U07_02095 [Actinobacteria bacterium]|nr:hypothetical protein [Actinomycetota bacterium]